MPGGPSPKFTLHGGAGTRQHITTWRDRLNLGEDPGAGAMTLEIEEMIL
jgi:hypothetical protein